MPEELLVIDDPIHGPRCCVWCEFFDGGGQAAIVDALADGKIINGDCLCGTSPRWNTTSNDTCEKFTLDGTWED